MAEQKYKNPHSVLVVIYAENCDQVLMLQRQDDPDFWQSVTGSLEENETPRQAAIRELWEEVRLKITENSTALFDCNESVEFEIFPHFRYKYAPNVTYCREHWFLLAVEREFIPQLSEHLAYQWVSLEQAVKMTKSPNNAEAIRKYLLNDKFVKTKKLSLLTK
ncbi:dihydroneopterin triphosphate diphosphatase [Rodentibacter pneumotropicus]|uniref:Dihydroneopterin triphosphate pyrophosphatase n=1 Tax=Rodentibacter pneumotropicus TaxID=758 RepID=A0A3S4TUD4_9PAST|nr:dihydroneopterin triphosphate diphosphatase [Rodentibacter pneumotropicus]NBH74504.1 dihydroneopterin triphosphate diphosphatase [Rodentibacter pneumotropicus]THA07322.1 dihydroneopterin triphosphate diphosphatase [Rodentibacter pneumotropicus]THA12138.1 dihydroneopterin triphosphate diphosphatase [Rodentibacter pneumotropicus]VEH66137.1 dihydroneopterin triphosphate pyrophosphatase [Rodentibacter pneumotropicus]